MGGMGGRWRWRWGEKRRIHCGEREERRGREMIRRLWSLGRREQGLEVRFVAGGGEVVLGRSDDRG